MPTRPDNLCDSLSVKPLLELELGCRVGLCLLQLGGEVRRVRRVAACGLPQGMLVQDVTGDCVEVGLGVELSGAVLLMWRHDHRWLWDRSWLNRQGGSCSRRIGGLRPRSGWRRT